MFEFSVNRQSPRPTISLGLTYVQVERWRIQSSFSRLQSSCSGIQSCRLLERGTIGRHRIGEQSTLGNTLQLLVLQAYMQERGWIVRERLRQDRSRRDSFAAAKTAGGDALQIVDYETLLVNGFALRIAQKILNLIGDW